MGADEGFDAFAVLGQRGLGGSEDRDDRILLLDEDFSAEFVDQAGHPRLDRPGRVDVSAGEEQDQFGVLRRDDLRVAAVHGDLESAFAQPDTGVDVLRVTELRRRETTTDEVLLALQAEALADHEGVTAAGNRRQDADLVALRADVGVDRRRRPDVGDVDRTGEQGLDGGRTGVERTPLDFGALRQVSEVPVGILTLELAGGEGRRVRQIREEADAESHRLLLGRA